MSMSDVDDVKPAPPAETTEVVAPVDVPVAVVERTAVVEQAPVAVPDYTTLRTGEVVAPLPAIRRPHVSLFLISFFILFFELACIRWFGSMVVFLTFFTNIVLLACFLGMSVGLLTAQRRANS